MNVADAVDAEDEAACDSLRRAALLMRLLIARHPAGLCLDELSRGSALERRTARCVLRGLMVARLVVQHRASGRYQLGPLAREMGRAARNALTSPPPPP